MPAPRTFSLAHDACASLYWLSTHARGELLDSEPPPSCPSAPASRLPPATPAAVGSLPAATLRPAGRAGADNRAAACCAACCCCCLRAWRRSSNSSAFSAGVAAAVAVAGLAVAVNVVCPPGDRLRCTVCSRNRVNAQRASPYRGALLSPQNTPRAWPSTYLAAALAALPPVCHAVMGVALSWGPSSAAFNAASTLLHRSSRSMTSRLFLCTH